MKRKLVTSLICMSVALAACGKKTEHVADESNKTNIIAEKARMDSEQLALAGEQLVNHYTFMLADEVLDAALDKNPNNKRAQLYKKFIKQFIVLEGIGTAIVPLVEKYGSMEQYNEFKDRTMPNSSARDFVFASATPIKTITDAQNLLVKIRDAQIELRQWLKDNQDLEIVLNLNPFVFQQSLQTEAGKNCEVIEHGSGVWKVVCNYREILQRKMNSADMIALQQMVAGQILYLTLYTSYTLEGITELADAQKANPKMTAMEAQKFLEDKSGFGKLRDDNSIGLIASLGADAVAAFKWVLNNQNVVCPSTEYPWQKRRKGYVFENGLCTHNVDSEDYKTLALVESALKGVVSVELNVKAQPLGYSYKRPFNMNFLAVLNNPVKDLRSIAPSAYSECGHATALRDYSVGGLFPDRDSAVLLDPTCPPQQTPVVGVEPVKPAN